MSYIGTLDSFIILDNNIKKYSLLAKGTEILKQFNYGCMAGDHTAYALVDVRDEEEARDLVPTFMRNKARIIEVGTSTPEVIKSLHGKAP